MTEMTGAAVVRLSTRTTCFAVFEYTHAWVEETADLWFIVFIRIVICDFDDRAFYDFVRTIDAKLDSHDLLDGVRWIMDSCGHSVLIVELFVYMAM